MEERGHDLADYSCIMMDTVGVEPFSQQKKYMSAQPSGKHPFTAKGKKCSCVRPRKKFHMYITGGIRSNKQTNLCHKFKEIL